MVTFEFQILAGDMYNSVTVLNRLMRRPIYPFFL